MSTAEWTCDEEDDEGPIDFSKTTSKISNNNFSSSSSSTTSDHLVSINCKIFSKKKGRPLPEELKDEAYWERRRKNNEAAKRSRDARRAKEYEVAIRATILEQENLKLRVEIASLKTELAKMRCLMYPAIQQQQQSNHSNGNRKSRESCCRHDHD